MINSWLRIIQKFLYPPVCLICGSPGENELDICFDCRVSLPYNRLCCRICGIRLPAETGVDQCGKCSFKRPDYDSTRSMFLYLEPVRYLIRSLKFHANHASARLLGHLMAEHLRSIDSALPELIVPVPLHPNRLRQRGFNQAIELARQVSKTLDIPMPLDLCIRRRDTTPQSGLQSKRRRKNVHGAFAITGPIQQKHVAIFDDVITTGCTVNEMAKILRRHGAETIEVWSIARANLGA